MRVVMLMFDSLNRHMLPAYGCDWTHAPNFRRLAERTVTFDNSYVCSMPCMPARRDLHTGRPNFLHRSWGPLEPFDDSVPEMLKNNGIHTHMTTDHYHYFEEGGATYHTRFQTYESFRGHEGDPWIGQVRVPDQGDAVAARADGFGDQDRINRQHMPTEFDQPQTKTIGAGIDYIRRNAKDDNWFLQIETFDPHEPFFTHRNYKDLYADHYRNYKGKHFDWPPYRKVDGETPEEIEHARFEYASLLSMCDARLGDLMDVMDEQNMWDDTMFIVWTDHGFMLGEHDCWAKCWQPFYQEIAHTPFFVWDPRSKKQGERRSALVQPSIDLGPTLLDFFGMDLTPDMTGKPLGETIANDAKVRDVALFGLHGGHVNITDGNNVYMRGPAEPANEPLFNYTLMPANMRHTFSPKELKGNIELAPPFKHTKECHVMKIGTAGKMPGGEDVRMRMPTMLFNVAEDESQSTPLDPNEHRDVVDRLSKGAVAVMDELNAPAEQYERVGLADYR